MRRQGVALTCVRHQLMCERDRESKRVGGREGERGINVNIISLTLDSLWEHHVSVFNLCDAQ